MAQFLYSWPPTCLQAQPMGLLVRLMSSIALHGEMAMIDPALGRERRT
jgi:hypothetical protein